MREEVENGGKMIKAVELLPTVENIKDTFLNDSIGRHKELMTFVRILDACDEHTSIAIDSAWGEGKTFFIKQAQLLLDSNNEQFDCEYKTEVKYKYYEEFKPTKQQVTVYYDAWANDNQDSPLLSIIYEITKKLGKRTASPKGPVKVTTIAKTIAALLKCLKGIDLESLGDAFKEIKEDLSLFQQIKDNNDISDKIHEYLDEATNENGDRLTIFIDELDRCKPSFAVQLLEEVKHYFTHERVTFVFAINKQELSEVIRSCYGSDFNADRYLDRFFDLTLMLPKADREKYLSTIMFSSNSGTYDKMCEAFIACNDLSLREIGRYIRLVNLAYRTQAHNKLGYDIFFDNSMHYPRMLFIPILIGLHMIDSRRFIRFIQGDDDTPFIEVLKRAHLLDGFVADIRGKKDDIETLSDEEKQKYAHQYYKAIFVDSLNEYNQSVQVGKYSIRDSIRDDMLNIIGLLSDFSTKHYTGTDKG